MKMGFAAGLALSALMLSGPLSASEPSSYFVSLKSDQVFMREGPSDKNRVKWVYHRKGLPLEVLASFEVWRRVKDMDGEIGWVHVAMLSRDRMVMVTGNADVTVRRGEEDATAEVASAKPGALGKLVRCGALACQVRFAAGGGWIDRTRLWGIRDGKDF